MKVQISLTPRELMALHNIINLAGQTVSDAEYDYEINNNGKKRRGGYSTDLKLAEKLEARLEAALEKSLLG